MKKIIVVLIPFVCGFIVLVFNNFSTVTNEKNYYANGSKFNISLPISIASISKEISDVNDSLVKEVNCNAILGVQTGYDKIPFNGCNFLTLIVVFELFDDEQRCLFKDYEIMTLTQNQINSLRNNKDRIKLRFRRDIQATLYLDDGLINSSNIIVERQDSDKIIPIDIFLKKDRNTIRIYERSVVGIIGTSSSMKNDRMFTITSKPKIIYGIERHIGHYIVFD
jgi:hypothetical protein